MPEIKKGHSCKNCFHCLVRVFHNEKQLTEWLIKKKIIPEEHQIIRWSNLIKTSQGVKLYWCKQEQPVKPFLTPPWWNKESIVGCLMENV